MPLNIKKDSKFKSSINLIVVQFCMFFIPLLAIPYIVGKVGIEKYGTFFFSRLLWDCCLLLEVMALFRQESVI